MRYSFIVTVVLAVPTLIETFSVCFQLFFCVLLCFSIYRHAFKLSAWKTLIYDLGFLELSI